MIRSGKAVMWLIVPILVMGMASSANADLILSPSTPDCGTPACLAATSNQVSNMTESQLETLLGLDPGTLEEVYKSNAGGSDEGPAATWYNTEFMPSDDPNDATITWLGGEFITGSPMYLLVKDGSAIPAQYIFDITGAWDGMETILLEDFWTVGAGAISHVSIYTGENGPIPGEQVPLPGTLMLLGAALAALGAGAGSRRLFRKND